MADIAIIELVERPDASTARIVGIFTDQQTFKIPFDVRVRPSSREAVRQALANALADARSGENVDKLIQPGEFDLTPSVVDPPSDEEIARSAWFALANRAAQLRGLLAPDNPEIAKAQQAADEAFKGEYIP